MATQNLEVYTKLTKFVKRRKVGNNIMERPSFFASAQILSEMRAGRVFPGAFISIVIFHFK